MENEIWKPINGYESLYEVSNLGNVRSLDKIAGGKAKRLIKGTLLKLRLDIGGYYIIGLWKNSKRSVKRVNRLVAEAFIPNPNNLPIVNHIDENRTNNNATNLEWCTQKYNVNFGNHNAKMSIAKTKHHIYQYSKDGKFIKEWLNPKEVERVLGIFSTSIYRVLSGKQKTAGGYIWKKK